MAKIERRYNVLFSGHNHTLSSGLLCVKHRVLHFPDVLLMPKLIIIEKNKEQIKTSTFHRYTQSLNKFNK